MGYAQNNFKPLSLNIYWCITKKKKKGKNTKKIFSIPSTTLPCQYRSSAMHLFKKKTYFWNFITLSDLLINVNVELDL